MPRCACAKGIRYSVCVCVCVSVCEYVCESAESSAKWLGTGHWYKCIIGAT